MSETGSDQVILNGDLAATLSEQLQRLLEVFENPAPSDQDPIQHILRFLEDWVAQAGRQSQELEVLSEKVDTLLEIVSRSSPYE